MCDIWCEKNIYEHVHGMTKLIHIGVFMLCIGFIDIIEDLIDIIGFRKS